MLRQEVTSNTAKPSTLDTRLRMLSHGPPLTCAALHADKMLVATAQDFLIQKERRAAAEKRRQAAEHVDKRTRFKISLAKKRPLICANKEDPLGVPSMSREVDVVSDDDEELVYSEDLKPEELFRDLCEAFAADPSGRSLGLPSLEQPVKKPRASAADSRVCAAVPGPPEEPADAEE